MKLKELKIYGWKIKLIYIFGNETIYQINM